MLDNFSVQELGKVEMQSINGGVVVVIMTTIAVMGYIGGAIWGGYQLAEAIDNQNND